MSSIFGVGISAPITDFHRMDGYVSALGGRLEESVVRGVAALGPLSTTLRNYYVDVKHRRRQVQVAVVGDTVEISIGEQLIRSHPVRHDRTRQHGALANPGGRARRSNAA